MSARLLVDLVDFFPDSSGGAGGGLFFSAFFSRKQAEFQKLNEQMCFRSGAGKGATGKTYDQESGGNPFKPLFSAVTFTGRNSDLCQALIVR